MAQTLKLAAILVADVVGCARLVGANEDGTLARLRGLCIDFIDPAIVSRSVKACWANSSHAAPTSNDWRKQWTDGHF
jgi:hypothetical protein